MASFAKSPKATGSPAAGRTRSAAGTESRIVAKRSRAEPSESEEAAERGKQGRPKASAAAPKAFRASKPPSRSPRMITAPKASKGELRLQVEKLEQIVVTLRARSRHANKAAKIAAGRIVELEEQLNQAAAATKSAASRKPKLPRSATDRRQGREIDPGDAVQGLAPPDEEGGAAPVDLEGRSAGG